MSLRQLFFCSAAILIVFPACQKTTSSGEATGGDTTSVVEGNQAEGQSASNMRTRGLGEAGSESAVFSFDDEFPLLSGLLAENEGLKQQVAAFAEAVLSPEAIQSEATLLAVLEQRDSLLTPVGDLITAADEAAPMYEQYDALQDELQRIGMQMTFAEGMLTSIGPSAFLEGKINEYATRPFQLYLEFQEAQTASFNGEYPFLNMKPYQEMIEVGEELASIDGNAYFPKIKEDYYKALRYFSDIHQVTDPTARNEGSLFVDGISTEMYPFMTEPDTRTAYVQETSGSPFAKAMDKIMANPSSMTARPEHLYLIVVEWANDADAAQSRVAAHLTKGEDVPHHLEVNLPDGSRKYAIVYRFFEDEDAAAEALNTAQQEFPAAELMMVSVNGDRLYQIGA